MIQNFMALSPVLPYVVLVVSFFALIKGADIFVEGASSLAKKLGVPCRKLLIKGANNKRQSSIDDREERKRNVSGVYRLATKDALVGKRILLVDDIVTSGSTISECAAVLKGAGCTEIYAAAVASAAP